MWSILFELTWGAVCFASGVANWAEGRPSGIVVMDFGLTAWFLWFGFRDLHRWAWGIVTLPLPKGMFSVTGLSPEPMPLLSATVQGPDPKRFGL